MNGYAKSALAELIGTFTLVFIGAMAGALADSNSAGLVAVALAHGIALTIIVYAWGPISGAHVNPAVTFGVLLGGKMPPSKAVVYWIAQFLGAAAAGVLLFWLIGIQGNLGATVGRLNDQIGKAADAQAKIVVVEAVLTFFLVTAVYGSAVSGRNGNAFGLAIGLVLSADILAGGPLTGAGMNPARSFRSALGMALGAKASMSYLWMYFVGPLAGGGVAGLLYSRLYLGKS